MFNHIITISTVLIIAAFSVTPTFCGESSLDTGERLMKEKKYAEAITALKKADRNHKSLSLIAESYEKQGDNESALAYYDLLSTFNSTDRKEVSLIKDAKKSAKKLDKTEDVIRVEMRDFKRNAEKLLKAMEKEGNDNGVAKASLAMGQAFPEEEEYFDRYYYIRSKPDANHAPQKPEKGYKSAFNHVDFDGWTVSRGDWTVSNGIIRGNWGWATYNKQQDDYKIIMVYKTIVGFRPDKPPHIGNLVFNYGNYQYDVWIQLAGDNAGVAHGIVGKDKYVTSSDTRPNLSKPSPFDDKGWNTMEISIKDNGKLKVELNGKTVYESNKRPWKIPPKKKDGFPGLISLNASPWIHIKSLQIK